ncbi:MAG: hypothetical protein CL840_21475 [Crocinitomicaceae bacterium]|nr:hypothetical protein [Crocinitomicaceae bacterium]|tara:strand:+ start:12995 stop:13702 length:708 start_codon:yes stop_codon:yes gene_type:complete
MVIAKFYFNKTSWHTLKMTRTLTILLTFLTTGTIAQGGHTVAHEYSILHEFVELRITDNKKVELYIWPHDDYLFSGQCIQTGDTLTLDLKAKNDSIEKSYSYPTDRALLKTVSKLLIVGDYLIPSILAIDTTNFGDSYIYSNGHIRYVLTFNGDSTYKYSHGDCISNGGSNGLWIKSNKQVKLEPDNEKNVLHWICTDNKLTSCMNYIVGVRDDKGVSTFKYLKKKRTPTKNKVH